jgi:hypothetical protein
MRQHQLIRAAVVGISTRQPRFPWLPMTVRSALNAYRLRLALTGA